MNEINRGYIVLFMNEGPLLVPSRESGEFKIPWKSMNPGEKPLEATLRDFKDATGFELHNFHGRFSGSFVCESRQYFVYHTPSRKRNFNTGGIRKENINHYHEKIVSEISSMLRISNVIMTGRMFRNKCF